MLSWMAYLLLVSGTMSLAGLALERALRPYGFATRWIWPCALVGSLALPAILSLTAARTLSPPLAARASLPETVRSSAPRAATPDWTAPIRLLPGRTGWARLDPLLEVAWGVSSGLAAAILVGGWWYGRRRRQRWRRASIAGVELLIAADAGPATVGLLHPQIVVPEWLLAAPRETLQVVIAHERCHVEARDPGLLGLGLGLAVLMPWNPFSWWQVSRLRAAIEVDCDRRVLRVGHDARLYARTLVDLGTRRPAYLAGLAAAPRSSSSIERRIVLMNTPKIHGWRVSTAVSAALSMAIATATPLVSPPSIPAALAATAASQEPTELERYVGDYEFPTMALVMRVQLRDGKLSADSVPLTYLSGQQFRYGEVGCCSPSSDSYIRFAVDATGHVIGAVFQQNGVASEAPRIDAQRVRTIEAAIHQRVSDQTAAPGSEAALRHLILGIASGNPTYGELSPQVAEGTKTLLTDLQSTMKPWGALRSIEFRGVDQRGWDRYLARFERGAASWEVSLDSYGLIVGVGTHPESN